jgi:hypothetical protein
MKLASSLGDIAQTCLPDGGNPSVLGATTIFGWPHMLNRAAPRAASIVLAARALRAVVLAWGACLLIALGCTTTAFGAVSPDAAPSPGAASGGPRPDAAPGATHSPAVVQPRAPAPSPPIVHTSAPAPTSGSSGSTSSSRAVGAATASRSAEPSSPAATIRPRFARQQRFARSQHVAPKRAAARHPGKTSSLSGSVAQKPAPRATVLPARRHTRVSGPAGALLLSTGLVLLLLAAVGGVLLAMLTRQTPQLVGE